MVEELDGLCVQGEVVGVLIVEEVDGELVCGASLCAKTIITDNLLSAERNKGRKS